MQKQSRSSALDSDNLREYPTLVNFYKTPPTLSVSLTDFESFALDRLQVLVAIDSARRFKDEADIFRLIEPILQKNLDVQSSRSKSLNEIIQQRRKDHISHFILRLAYCKTPELRKWFCTVEELLFKKRLLMLPLDEREKFLAINEIQFTSVSVDEMLKETKLSSKDLLFYGEKPTSFFKVPFALATNLVAKRQVVVHKGYCYVNSTERNHLIAQAFSRHLMDELVKTAKALPRMDEDDRIMPILFNLAKQSISSEYQIQSDGPGINASDIKALVAHFPLCMRSLQVTLDRESHLKHNGRLQYGLFLKGIGLSLEQALIFWRNSFNKMSDEEFNKKGYPYNIRYNYGKEGKRTNYTPYSCVKIIQSNPAPGDTHGCPFRQYSPESLMATLQQLDVDVNSINEILSRASSGMYQNACSRLFEVLKKKRDGTESILLEPIDHPNKYFDLSRAAPAPPQ